VVYLIKKPDFALIYINHLPVIIFCMKDENESQLFIMHLRAGFAGPEMGRTAGPHENKRGFFITAMRI